MGERWHGDYAIHRLPAGHANRIDIQQFIGDVGPSRHRLANGQRAGMEKGAIA